MNSSVNNSKESTSRLSPRWLVAGLIGLVSLLLVPAVALATSGDHPAVDEVWSRTLAFVTLEYDFLKHTLLGMVMVGLTCGLLGVFMVLRKLSLMGDALGHAALPGIGVAFLIVQTKALLPLAAGAFSTALLAAFAIGFITKNSKTRPDAALGIVLAGFFGAGVVIFSFLQNSPTAAKSGLSDFLFGNAAALSAEDNWLLAGILVLTLVSISACYRQLKLMTFDLVLAQTMGVPVRALHYGLMALAALAIVASLQSVGVILVSAMIIIPPATARLLTNRFAVMLALSPLIGGAAGVIGAWASFVFEGFSSGPSMVLAAALFFGLAFLFSPSRGLFVRAAQNSQRERIPTKPLRRPRVGGEVTT